MPAILFVCTANVCRSPMASVIFRHIVIQAGLSSDWRVESAGTWAMDGAPASSGSIFALSKKGIHLDNHQARRITNEMLTNFDLILTMERGHKEALHVEFPDSADRIYLLSEMVGEDFDIIDPIGGPFEDYEETADIIERILVDGFNRIRDLSVITKPSNSLGD